MMILRGSLSAQSKPRHRFLSAGSGPADRRALAVAALLAVCGTAQAQSWTPLAHPPPGAINLMLLMTDGTVMAAANNGSTIGNGWYKLTPDASGSYTNGTWTTLASSPNTRLYFASQVLRDGRVWMAGGEYGTGGARCDIYDPVTNTWSTHNPPTTLMDPSQTSPATGIAQQFYDSNSELLPDGRVLVMPVCPKVNGQPLIYDPVANTWVAGPLLFRGVYQDEATWEKLPDNTILTVDPFGTNSERFDPVGNHWINDGIVPVQLYDSFGSEMGGGMLLPNGKALYLGATGHVALYTPSGGTAPGVWTAAPDIHDTATTPPVVDRGMPDAPCAMEVNGKVLLVASPVPTSANHFPTPSYFFEYDYTTNTFSSAIAPVGGLGGSDPIPTYEAAMLNLPSGQIMYSHMSTSAYIFTPGGSPLSAGKPTINTITLNGDGSFHLTGTLLNGLCEGASYGDDLQMNSNYPIVRINHSNGNKYFAKSYNWSSTGVMTGATVNSTEYKVPATMPTGTYSVTVIANGIASDAAAGAGISSHPDPQTVCSGTSASFSVTATGVGPVSYQWRRGTTNLTDTGNVSGSATATLTINPAGMGDAGPDYNCVVTNVLGTGTSNSAALTVNNCCYANCDQSTSDPILNANDFQCFLNAFAANDPYANCDQSTTAPVLNANDFQCFLNAFAAGCS
jgi:hypothetical protein